MHATQLMGLQNKNLKLTNFSFTKYSLQIQGYLDKVA